MMKLQDYYKVYMEGSSKAKEFNPMYQMKQMWQYKQAKKREENLGFNTVEKVNSFECSVKTVITDDITEEQYKSIVKELVEIDKLKTMAYRVVCGISYMSKLLEIEE